MALIFFFQIYENVLFHFFCFTNIIIQYSVFTSVISTAVKAFFLPLLSKFVSFYFCYFFYTCTTFKNENARIFGHKENIALKQFPVPTRKITINFCQFTTHTTHL